MTCSISYPPSSCAAAAGVDSRYTATFGASPEERLLALVIYTQSSQLSAAKTSVNLNFEEIERLRQEIKQALDEAKQAKKDAGFWGDLAKIFGSDLATIATAIAAVAAVVASGGAAAAVLAVIASAATFAADHAEQLGIPPEVAMVIAVTASIAALCSGDAKGLFEVGAKVKDIARDVKLWANVGAGVATAAGGGCSMLEGQYVGDAGHHRADARHADGQRQLVSADIDAALEDFSAVLDQQAEAVELTNSIQQQRSAANHFILNNLAGAA